MREVDVAIIGAGTAGLSARSLVARKTDNYLVIDDGPMGTTCARVGCMPSKVLIQVANDYHKRLSLVEEGISGGESLSIDHRLVMQHVRKLRDRFVRSVVGSLDKWDDKLIRKRAKFVDANTLDLGDEQVRAKSIVIGAGSTPVFPEEWKQYEKYVINSDTFFELEELPNSVAVIGLGVIGIELGQALNRIGVKVTGISRRKNIGALSDPDLQNYAADLFAKEFPILYGTPTIKEERDGKIVLEVNGEEVVVEKVFLSIGRRPLTKELALDTLDIDLDKRGIPVYDRNTMQIPGTRIFIAGDVTGERPLLHEAADEGNIAGYNAVQEDSRSFRRRELLAITFADPNIAIVGKSYRELTEQNIDFATGAVSYEGFGRAIIQLKEKGLMHIYGDKNTGRLLGAEILAPSGEHLAHLVAWAINLKLGVHEALALPYYHPVIEEGINTALRDLAKKINLDRPPLENIPCEESPAGVRCD